MKPLWLDYSSRIEKVKTIIIITYLAITSVGVIFGAGPAKIAQKYVGRAIM